ncbi:MAG TPA: PAS domain S-box protein [Myxococcales bacterium]|jgi:two-component system CheB/CheR fusion protein
MPLKTRTKRDAKAGQRPARGPSKPARKCQPHEGAQVREELRAAKERLGVLLENSPMAAIEWELPAFRIVHWSAGAARVFGWTAEEATGKRFDELDWIHPADKAVVRQAVADMIAGVRPRNQVRNRNVRKDGSVIHCDWYNSTFLNASGNVSVLSLVSDVTEQVRANEALRLKEERFRVALKDSPVTIATLDRELRFTWINNPPWGFAPEAIVGRRPNELLDLDEGVRSLEMMRRALETGEPGERLVAGRLGGRTLHLQVRAEPLRDEHGAIAGLLVATIDLSEQKQAEESLRLSEERFRAALHDSPVTVATLDRDLRYTWVYNPPRGLSSADMLGKRPDELADLEPDDQGLGMLHEVLETGVAGSRLVRGKSRAEAFHCLVRAEPLRDRSGRVAGLTLAIIDQTEQKRAEEALREADRHKNEFLAILSHELRNPLSSIKANLYLLDRVAPGTERAKQAKEVIARQADRLAMLVDDLLDVTRIARGKVELSRGRVDLGEVVRTALDDCRVLFENRGVGVEAVLSPAPILVEADRVRLGQVAGNLLHNAAKFTPRGGSARVSVALEDGQAVLRLADSGVGLEARHLARVFEPFMQADRTFERASGGLGLGLALVKSLVELHGGKVSAHSEGLGRGSEFVVRLPLAPGAEAVAAGTPVPSPRGHRVLIIEDNVDLAEALRDILQVAGHDVAVAFDGPAGVVKAREHLPEAVFCDIGLPGMNGYEVARELRACPALAETMLVALSGYAQAEDLVRAREAGFARHLAKPPRIEAVEALIDGLPARAH